MGGISTNSTARERMAVSHPGVPNIRPGFALIYGLVNPDTNEVCYVGSTEKPLERFKEYRWKFRRHHGFTPFMLSIRIVPAPRRWTAEATATRYYARRGQARLNDINNPTHPARRVAVAFFKHPERPRLMIRCANGFVGSRKFNRGDEQDLKETVEYLIAKATENSATEGIAAECILRMVHRKRDEGEI